MNRVRTVVVTVPCLFFLICCKIKREASDCVFNRNAWMWCLPSSQSPYSPLAPLEGAVGSVKSSHLHHPHPHPHLLTWRFHQFGFSLSPCAFIKPNQNRVWGPDMFLSPLSHPGHCCWLRVVASCLSSKPENVTGDDKHVIHSLIMHPHTPPTSPLHLRRKGLEETPCLFYFLIFSFLTLPLKKPGGRLWQRRWPTEALSPLWAEVPLGKRGGGQSKQPAGAITWHISIQFPLQSVFIFRLMAGRWAGAFGQELILESKQIFWGAKSSINYWFFYTHDAGSP